MKKVLIALVVMMTATFVLAQADKPAPGAAAKTTELTGKVAVIKDEAGTLKSLELKVGDKSYFIKQDANSKGLLELNNKNVTVTGTLDEKGTTITVVKFAIVEEKKAEESKAETE